jgi:hypothetical protein
MHPRILYSTKRGFRIDTDCPLQVRICPDVLAPARDLAGEHGREECSCSGEDTQRNGFIGVSLNDREYFAFFMIFRNNNAVRKN